MVDTRLKQNTSLSSLQDELVLVGNEKNEKHISLINFFFSGIWYLFEDDFKIETKP